MTFERWITELKGIYETRNLADKSMTDFSYQYWGVYYNASFQYAERLPLGQSRYHRYK